MLLDSSPPDGEWRKQVYTAIGHDELAQALVDVSGLVGPPRDVVYRELAGKLATVKRFLPTLLRVIQFDANPAGRPLVQLMIRRPPSTRRRGSAMSLARMAGSMRRPSLSAPSTKPRRDSHAHQERHRHTGA